MLIQVIMFCSFFALLYALKGGSGKDIFPWWSKLRATNRITERLLDGKVISTSLLFVVSLFVTLDILTSLVFSAAWLAAVAPSMGEEHGAIGRYKKAWGDYLDYPDSFGRMYGVKKGLQRGVWMGACMVLATGYIPYICFSLLFVPCVFIGQELYFRLYKTDSWVLSEPLIGAIVFGIPTALMV